MKRYDGDYYICLGRRPGAPKWAPLLARRQPHNAPLLHSPWAIQKVVTEEYRILGSVNYELATHTPAAWIQVFKQRLSPLLSLVPPDVLKILLTRTCWSSHSLWTRGPAMWEARRGFSHARSGSVSKWPECAWGDATLARFVWHAPSRDHLQFSARLLHW